MGAEAAFDPVALLRVLNRHEVQYVVVGGFAAAAHGVVRATRDLDVVVERSWDNAARLASALGELDARSVTEPGADLDQEALVRRADRRLETRFGELHVLHEVPGVPRFSGLTAEVIEVDGETMQVCSLDDLRRMKRAAGRDKDRVDLAELDELHGPASDA